MINWGLDKEIVIVYSYIILACLLFIFWNIFEFELNIISWLVSLNFRYTFTLLNHIEQQAIIRKENLNKLMKSLGSFQTFKVNFKTRIQRFQL